MLLAGLVFGVIASVASRACERWFGGYFWGTGLVYTAMFAVLWKGNTFEFFFNTVFYSFVLLVPLFWIGQVGGALWSTRDELGALEARTEEAARRVSAGCGRPTDEPRAPGPPHDGVAPRAQRRAASHDLGAGGGARPRRRSTSTCWRSPTARRPEAVRPDPALAHDAVRRARGGRDAAVWAGRSRRARRTSSMTTGCGCRPTTPPHAPRASSGVPFVVSTRGMLEPWARQNSRLKKSVAWWAYQRRDLASAAVLHATAPSEADALRSVGLRAPIAVIPNGVARPARRGPARRGRSGAPRRALFLSRVHPKKGLPLLLDAWAEVRPHRLGAGHRRPGRGRPPGRARSAGGRDWVWTRCRFWAPSATTTSGTCTARPTCSCCRRTAKTSASWSPRRSRPACPSLTTTGAPWADLQAHRSGWWVEPEPRPLARGAPRPRPTTSDAKRAAMGERGRALVAEVVRLGRDRRPDARGLRVDPRPPVLAPPPASRSTNAVPPVTPPASTSGPTAPPASTRGARWRCACCGCRDSTSLRWSPRPFFGVAAVRCCACSARPSATHVARPQLDARDHALEPHPRRVGRHR